MEGKLSRWGAVLRRISLSVNPERYVKAIYIHVQIKLFREWNFRIKKKRPPNFRGKSEFNFPADTFAPEI